ncbi:MAG: hypothetical protein MUF61_02590 [archaeon]|jgi:hypothetical protein|nr:hypothetical protein [archaeon]
MASKRAKEQEIVLNQRAVGQGVVHREKGFPVFYSGTAPFRDGQEVYVVKKNDWVSLLHELALSEHLSLMPPISMITPVARRFPLSLEPRVDGVSTKYILDHNIYRPYKDMLLIRYITPEEGIAIMERSKGIKNPITGR